MSGADPPSLIEKVASRLHAAAGHERLVIEPGPARPAVDPPAAAPPAPESRQEAPQPGPEAAPVPLPQDLAGGRWQRPPPRPVRRSAERLVDVTRLQAAGMLSPGTGASPLAEQFRIIKRPLLLAAFPENPLPSQKNANVIMVTSARPGEGKTFVAVNLAMSMALERDVKVLLIDADVHRSTALDALGVEAAQGLTHLLKDPTIDVSQVMIRALNVPHLTMVPVGERHPHATELFASQRMEQLIDSMATRYSDRVIIIDTPPVLASTEASVLALRVGQAVMVVQATHTSKRAVERATAMISACPSISLVLNKSKASIGTEEFGAYGYTYRRREDQKLKKGA